MCDWPTSKSTQSVEFDADFISDENTATSRESQTILKLGVSHVSYHVHKIARNMFFSRISKFREH